MPDHRSARSRRMRLRLGCGRLWFRLGGGIARSGFGARWFGERPRTGQSSVRPGSHRRSRGADRVRPGRHARRWRKSRRTSGRIRVGAGFRTFTDRQLTVGSFPLAERRRWGWLPAGRGVVGRRQTSQRYPKRALPDTRRSRKVGRSMRTERDRKNRRSRSVWAVAPACGVPARPRWRR